MTCSALPGRDPGVKLSVIIKHKEIGETCQMLICHSTVIKRLRFSQTLIICAFFLPCADTKLSQSLPRIKMSLQLTFLVKVCGQMTHTVLYKKRKFLDRIIELMDLLSSVLFYNWADVEGEILLCANTSPCNNISKAASYKSQKKATHPRFEAAW